MPLVVKKDETFDPVNVSLLGSIAILPRRITWRTWSSNFGFGAVGGVEASVLKFNPPSITASVWFVGLCVLTLFIIMTLLVISRIAAPLSRGGRHQPSVTSLSVHSNCRNDGTKFSRVKRWISFRPIFLEPFQKKKLRTLAVPIVPVVPRIQTARSPLQRLERLNS